MKKAASFLTFSKLILAASIALFVFQSSPNGAKAGAGCLWPTDASYLQADKTSATADGQDRIIITANSGCHAADGTWEYSNNDTLRITVSGSGNSISPDQQKNNLAAVNFTVVSSVAEQKTVQMQYWAPIDLDHPDVYTWYSVGDPMNIRFTSATPASTGQFSSSTPRATASTQTVTQQTAKPAAPVISTVNSTQLPDSKTSSQIIRKGEQITFSGTAAANATIKLYIYSDDPITAETTADGDGNWSYTLADQLAVGDHRVEAETIDASGNTSDRTEIAKFSVKDKVIPIEPEDSFSPNYLTAPPLVIGLASLAILLTAFLIYTVIKRRRKTAPQTNLS